MLEENASMCNALFEGKDVQFSACASPDSDGTVYLAGSRLFLAILGINSFPECAFRLLSSVRSSGLFDNNSGLFAF